MNKLICMSKLLKAIGLTALKVLQSALYGLLSAICTIKRGVKPLLICPYKYKDSLYNNHAIAYMLMSSLFNRPKIKNFIQISGYDLRY